MKVFALFLLEVVVYDLQILFGAVARRFYAFISRLRLVDFGFLRLVLPQISAKEEGHEVIRIFGILLILAQVLEISFVKAWVVLDAGDELLKLHLSSGHTHSDY